MFLLNIESLLFRETKQPVGFLPLNFAKTEDIWLKSALEEKRGVLLISGRT